MEPVIQNARFTLAQERNFRIQNCAFNALSEYYVLNPIPKSERAQARNLLLMESTCRDIENRRR